MNPAKIDELKRIIKSKPGRTSRLINDGGR
jgi:hypothetical protein